MQTNNYVCMCNHGDYFNYAKTVQKISSEINDVVY